MKQNLISSRVPIFPSGASGSVVVAAIVTARGTVEPVRVVSGNPALAQPAMAAVATWHYRPYLQNGVPVNVSTTISVDSTGND
jgi:protein TonB